MSRILDLIERLFDPIIPNYCVDMSGEILDDLDVLVEQLPIDSRESAISKSLTFYKNVSNLIDVDQESILECYGKELNITEYFQFSDSSDQVLEGISTRFFRFSKCDEEAFRAGFDYSGKKFIDEMVQKLSSPNREMIVVRSLSLYHIIHERFEFAADVNLFNGNNKYRVLLQRNTEPDNNEADYRNGEVIDMSDHFKNKQEINLPGYK